MSGKCFKESFLWAVVPSHLTTGSSKDTSDAQFKCHNHDILLPSFPSRTKRFLFVIRHFLKGT